MKELARLGQLADAHAELEAKATALKLRLLEKYQPKGEEEEATMGQSGGSGAARSGGQHARVSASIPRFWRDFPGGRGSETCKPPTPWPVGCESVFELI